MTNRSRSELKRLARGFLLGNYTVPILAMLTAAVLPAALLTPFSIGLTAELNFAMVAYILAAIIIKILGQLLAVGVTRMHFSLARGQNISYLDLFWAFRSHPDRLIAATLLLMVILGVPAIPAVAGIFYLTKWESAVSYLFAGLILLVFAVVDLYLAYLFELIYFLYMDHPEMTVREGFRTSAALMQGNKKRLLMLHLSFAGWLLLGVCSMGIGTLWIRPYMTQTVVNFYLDLTGGFDKKGMHIDASVEGPVFS